MKRRNEILVGGLLIVALLLGITGTIWLVRGGLNRGSPLYSVFRWGANLKVGQPVVLAGVPIGYVSQVDLHDDGRLVVKLAINKGRKVPRNGRAVVEAVGIFGDAQVAVQATPSPAVYASGDTIPAGVPAAGIPELTAKADSVATTAVALSRQIQAELVDSGTMRDVRRMLAQTNALVAQFSSIAAVQNRQLAALEGRATRLLASVDSAKIDSTLTNVRAVSANANALTDSLRVTTTQINALLGNVRNGQGTLGKLASDSLLYVDIRRLVTRLDSLTADFQKNPRKYVNLRIF
jgi:phospholipid/cholesterol/gamma-HCH transport system substrate-binding protein